MSTHSIASSSPMADASPSSTLDAGPSTAAEASSSSTAAPSPSSTADAAPSCRACGAPLAADQRYCLECGERLTPMSSVLLGGAPAHGDAARSPGGMPPGGAHTAPQAPAATAGRGQTTTVIAGVGVLLLAMGVGVLIGRSGASKATAAPAQVISVSSTPAGGAGAGASTAPAQFSDDWPEGTSGYTVQLQTLPEAGTQVAAVEAAKTAASAKGAAGVGALKSEDFSSLTAGSYVIYSGVYHKKTEAEKALPALKKSFSGASVIQVSKGGSGSSGGSGGAGAGVGSSPTHPAPPSVLKNLRTTKGQSFEQKSKNLPNVISTG